jgi:glutamine cyclotransferase
MNLFNGSPLRGIPITVQKLLFIALIAAVFNACDPASSTANVSTTPSPAASAAPQPPPTHHFRVVNVFPHDPMAFTQGLVFSEGKLLESTGQEGRSTLRSVELQNGNILKSVKVPLPYFAEGIALLNGKIYQLTWQHQVGFIYDAQSFAKVGEFKYAGEGWGLATDGRSLLLSDGTNRIRYIDPNTFNVTKTISVLDGKTPIVELNELEYIKGELYANVWHDDRVAVIDPESGVVKSWIDFKGLLQPGDVQDEEAVLNGIAFDESSNRLFVTGKLWPRIFEVEIKK